MPFYSIKYVLLIIKNNHFLEIRNSSLGKIIPISYKSVQAPTWQFRSISIIVCAALSTNHCPAGEWDNLNVNIVKTAENAAAFCDDNFMIKSSYF